MTHTTTARIDRTPTYNDLEIAHLVRRALADVQDAGRFGDRKVFIASLWTTMLAIEAAVGSTLTEGSTIEHFKAWLLGVWRLTHDGTEHGAPLIVLCRADLVAAMDPALVAASETTTDGCGVSLRARSAGGARRIRASQGGGAERHDGQGREGGSLAASRVADRE